MCFKGKLLFFVSMSEKYKGPAKGGIFWFSYFAKLETGFIRYILYIRNILRKNCFAKFCENMMKLMKHLKHTFLTSKCTFEVVSRCFVFCETQKKEYSVYSTIHRIYCVKIKFLILQKNCSNSNSDLNIHL